VAHFLSVLWLLKIFFVDMWTVAMCARLVVKTPSKSSTVLPANNETFVFSGCPPIWLEFLARFDSHIFFCTSDGIGNRYMLFGTDPLVLT
jgi:hypothetical protein